MPPAGPGRNGRTFGSADPFRKPRFRPVADEEPGKEKAGRQMPPGLVQFPGTRPKPGSGAYFFSSVQIALYSLTVSPSQGGRNSGAGALAGMMISGASAISFFMNFSLPTMPLA